MFSIFTKLIASVAALSCLLQGDDAIIDTLVNSVQKTQTKITTFDCYKEIKTFKNSSIKDGIFRDTLLTVRRTGMRGVDENYVRSQGELLLNNLKTALIERFGALSSDGDLGEYPEMVLFSVFDPSKLPDGDEDNLSEYGKDEIQQLTLKFSNLLTSKGYDRDKIEDERVLLWKHVIYVLKTTTKEGRSIKTFWPKVLRKKGDSSDLRNILSLVA